MWYLLQKKNMLRKLGVWKQHTRLRVLRFSFLPLMSGGPGLVNLEHSGCCFSRLGCQALPSENGPPFTICLLIVCLLWAVGFLGTGFCDFPTALFSNRSQCLTLSMQICWMCEWISVTLLWFHEYVLFNVQVLLVFVRSLVWVQGI